MKAAEQLRFALGIQNYVLPDNSKAELAAAQQVLDALGNFIGGNCLAGTGTAGESLKRVYDAWKFIHGGS
jgi:hypothetical protein